MKESKRNYILEVNLLYLLLGLLLFFLGSVVQDREIYSGLLITEYIIILIPNLIYMKSKKIPLKQSLRLNKISLRQIGYIILITIFSYPIAIFFNTLVMTILGFFGELIPSSVPLPENMGLYFLSIFIIALAPGICEEVMFRGAMMDAYSIMGKKKAIIYSAFLFGLFHLNLQNLLGPIFLGIIFGIIVYKTNSIYSSILAHILNNSIAMTIGYFGMKAQSEIGEIKAYEVPNQIQMLILLLTIGIFALISSIILIKLIKKLPPGEIIIKDDVQYEDTKFVYYLPIVGIIFLFIIINIKYLFI
ncbi:CPBP family intramembrane glutamic endopeptidase [Tissierella sp.]|uniref:CPBP family intramembrane glutamic endopeptidase n=1 Tax=Tissierella sp. TaxID=41274 RepID=UPI0028ADDFDF|nr:CPBP family intramembrane glutamic endopeptidase [Tissierella sp.]